MNPQEAKDRAEQEAADQVEERRVAREDTRWAEEALDGQEGKPVFFEDIPPYLFADERSQRRVEEEARHERPLDDYAAWTDQNEQLFR
jgi:hypothetical protein